MTANTLILIAIIIAAMAAMALLGRGLPSRYRWWGSTYGTTNKLKGKDS